jgi:L-rhamnose mutarotase
MLAGHSVLRWSGFETRDSGFDDLQLADDFTLLRVSFAVLRKAFRMAIHPGQAAEYERRHRPIWQDLEATLLEHGVRSYSIFLDPQTNDLFGYVELDSEEQWAAIAQTDVCRRWWRYMREIMPSNDDDSPVSREMREMFHISR